jgi:hypothetical protein
MGGVPWGEGNEGYPNAATLVTADKELAALALKQGVKMFRSG